MDKNPFSLFDFMGYFIPGAFALFIIYFLQNDNGLLYYFEVDNVKSFTTEISLIYLTFYVILAYTFGHILSFLSTLTIENFTIWAFGYPLKNLLGLNNNIKYFVVKRNGQNTLKLITFWSFVLRISLGIFLLPISVSVLTVGNLLNLNNSVYKKNIGKPYVELLKGKIKDVFKQLDSNITIDYTKHDYNKLLIYYSYNINTTHQPKLMNYVSLYGFLRVMAFIFNSLSVFILYKIFSSEDGLILNLYSDFNEKSILFFLSSFFSYISFLGYLKFYRRYTQENLMILLL